MENQRKFQMPHTLIGRSIFLLICAYIVTSIFYFVCWSIYDISGLYGALANILSQRDNPISIALDEYVISLPIALYGKLILFIYFIVNTGTIWLIVYTAFRFARNPRFTEREYYQIWVIVFAIFFAIPEIVGFLKIMDEGYSSFNLYTLLVVNPLQLVMYIYMTRIFFVKIPIDSCAGSNVTEDENTINFIGTNLDYVKYRIKKFGIVKSIVLVIALLGIFTGIDFLIFLSRYL